MKKTKIICTIGPATDSWDLVRAMAQAGMNAARLNFSHGTHAEHKVRIDLVKSVRDELQQPIAILLDTKGDAVNKGAAWREESDLFAFASQFKVCVVGTGREGVVGPEIARHGNAGFGVKPISPDAQVTARQDGRAIGNAPAEEGRIGQRQPL